MYNVVLFIFLVPGSTSVILSKMSPDEHYVDMIKKHFTENNRKLTTKQMEKPTARGDVIDNLSSVSKVTIIVTSIVLQLKLYGHQKTYI